MADYFSEYTSFIGNKGLPSPADTPYETPAFIRSKRSSRATTIGSKSREQSQSPPPLPPDPADVPERGRDGRYTALDPRRFTPTLHASLVAEILSLRRELDSKNHLVENLETGLAAAKDDNEQLIEQLTTSAKEVRNARSQVQQMETGTYEALEAIAKERNTAQQTANELRLKLDVAHKKVKLQDTDAERTQAIWEREKDSWENERRQLERRIHVTETRLRTFVDEMVSQQAEQQTVQAGGEVEDESRFKDSGLGDESDAESNVAAPIATHRRDFSNASFKSSSNKLSGREPTTPEPVTAQGFSLADELGDDDDDYDDDRLDVVDDELDYHDTVRRTMDSRQSNLNGEIESKAKRVLGLTDEIPDSPARSHSRFGSVDSTRQLNDASMHKRSASKQSVEESPRKADFSPRPLSILPEHPPQAVSEQAKHRYVDNGYQPSPPPSPPLQPEGAISQIAPPIINIEPVSTELTPPVQGRAKVTPPMSPPETPVLGADAWSGDVRTAHTDASTQTDAVEATPSSSAPVPVPVVPQASNRDSLQLPVLVPSISIVPPTSRPTTPRNYVLPPGTKNASTQAALSWPSTDASVQTEEIRIDQRPVKLPPHLLPSYVLRNLPEPAQIRSYDDAPGTAKIFESKRTPTSASQPPMGPIADSIGLALSRDNSSKDVRSMPLKAISLPKPTLAPAISMHEKSNAHGPLNRSAQFGVSHDNLASRLLASMDDSDDSDTEPGVAVIRPVASVQRQTGRFMPSEHPRNVPEDKELSPERRPLTTESVDAAPAPSIASSREAREAAHRIRKRPPPKLKTYANLRSRSPSFGSVESSTWSAQSSMPPYPIPTRSSSRQPPSQFSEDPYSHVDPFVPQTATEPKSLRKVQSTTSIRHAKTRISPRRPRRRRRSPELTPVQSMAFESPAPTNFPIPELPTPLQHGPSSDYQWGSRSSRPAGTSVSSLPYGDETGLIDSIAATMVGEWMWKYIRKRKSFGVNESTEDFAQAAQDGSVDIPGIGSRHKRWVWLSPYERTIMWDSKQPTSGTALLGKKGRKLIIQSVLDVKDDTPLPKKPELESAHGRSILILTPARALKFTTTTAERHQFWMTALSFLAESNRMDNQLPPLPLVPPAPQRAPPPPPIGGLKTKAQSPSFGRASIRDSVRLAKVKQPEQSSQQIQHATSETNGYHHDDGADFPAIPRLYSGTSRHQRKRSNTASPRLPPPLNTLRSFSSTAISTTSSQPYGHANGSAGKNNGPGSSYSAGASVTSPDRPNFFEATGTVRMEAFVDPNVKNGVLYVPAPPGAAAAQQPRRRRGDSNLSTTTLDKRRAGYVFDEEGMDPFKGF